MGFKLNINNILRQSSSESLEVGKEYPFEKSGLSLLADDIQIWLAAEDWTALAEIQITSQQRKDGKTSGTYVVKHLYTSDEQVALSGVFKRMYGWR